MSNEYGVGLFLLGVFIGINLDYLWSLYVKRLQDRRESNDGLG